jgi:hypothetical protein
VVEVLGDGAGSGKHGNAAVLDLGLAEELDVAEGGEAKGIKAHIACIHRHVRVTAKCAFHSTAVNAPARGKMHRRAEESCSPGSFDNSAAFAGSMRKGTDADLACMVGPRATAIPASAGNHVTRTWSRPR